LNREKVGVERVPSRMFVGGYRQRGIRHGPKALVILLFFMVCVLQQRCAGYRYSPTLTRIKTLSKAKINAFDGAIEEVDYAEKKRVLQSDLDIMGQINFCLRPSDRALSGPSRSKIVNEITNDVFKSIIIGYDPLIEEVLQAFPDYKAMTARTACVLDPVVDDANSLDEDGPEEPTIEFIEPGARSSASRSSKSSSINSVINKTNKNSILVDAEESEDESTRQAVPQIDTCDLDLELSLKYIDWLERLLKTGTVTSDEVLGGIYDSGYKRLLTALKNSGCVFPNSFGTNQQPTSRPVPIDRNICMSILDMQLKGSSGMMGSMGGDASASASGGVADTASATGYASKTTELNEISNIVGRTMLFGGKKEKNSIAGQLLEYCQGFADKWLDGNMQSQEVNYIKVLALLLTADLATAEAASTGSYREELEDGETSSLSSSSSSSSSSSRASGSVSTSTRSSSASSTSSSSGSTKRSPPSITAKVIANSKSTADATSSASSASASASSTAASAAVSDKYSDASGLYRDISNALSGGIGAVEGLDASSLRLFDNYQNAFHRVVEMCISTNVDEDLLNDEILQSFLVWEQSIRRSLTNDLWMSNPKELVGKWNLIDVPGNGNLREIMTIPTEELSKIQNEEMVVEFAQNGDVILPKSSANTGLVWNFKPGPAHLDTCQFFVKSGSKPDLLLQFVGNIDRGQRIESRFSSRPIRMSGRVLSIVRDEPKGSSRFVMELRRNK